MSEFFAEDAFAPTSEADWRRLVDKALAGASFDTLVSTSEDGVRYGPIHQRRSPVRPVLRNEPGTPWRIVQRMDDPDPVRANAQALSDLEGGADALSLVFEGAPSAYGFGLPVTQEAVATALAGVMPDLIHIRVEPHRRTKDTVTALKQALSRRGDVDVDALSLDHGFDPVGCSAAMGRLRKDDAPRLRDEVRAYRRWVSEQGTGNRPFEADGRVYHDAGASDAQELGTVLATALFYLRALAEESDPADAARFIGFTLVADQKQFLVTAKFRALRLLWARLLQACGVDETRRGARVHAQTSFRMMSALDPHANVLRTTVAAFAAATGGADSLSVLPYTLAHGLPEAKARRLARNVQAILQDESGLALVADPAAGSGGIETLTEGLARAGWEEFRRIEAEGGIVGSLGSNALQARIATARSERMTAIDERRETVIGATAYRLDAERDVSVLMRRSGMLDQEAEAGSEPLRPHRLTDVMERVA